MHFQQRHGVSFFSITWLQFQKQSGSKLRRGMLALLLLSLAACSNDRDTGKDGSGGDKNQWAAELGIDLQIFSSPVLQVVNENLEALENVRILIGSAPGQPFPNNELQTDAQGLAVAPPSWILPEMVTLLKPGHIPTTYANLAPQHRRLVVKTLPLRPKIEVSGEATQLPVRNRDGIGDFAFVLPGLSTQQVLGFSISNVLNPDKDIIKVSGNDIAVPANLSLPQQTERYSIISITMDKPQFRVQVEKLGKQSLFAIRGQFPFRKVVDEFRAGKSFVDVLNEFSIQAGGWVEPLILGKTSGLQINSSQIPFKLSAQVQAPRIAPDEIILNASLIRQNEVWYPSDVKSLESGKVQSLVYPDQSTPHLLSLLKKENEVLVGPGSDRLSAVFVAFQNNSKPEFLPLLPNPRVQDWSRWQMQTPTLLQGMNSTGSFATLSQVTYVTDKSGKKILREILTPAWQVYSPEWITSLELPDLPQLEPKSPTRRWTISYLASSQNQMPESGPELFEKSSHISTSSQDF